MSRSRDIETAIDIDIDIDTHIHTQPYTIFVLHKLKLIKLVKEKMTQSLLLVYSHVNLLLSAHPNDIPVP